jgi:hypothetical protein
MANLGKPDVTTCDSFADVCFDSFGCSVPQVSGQVYASLSPRELVARCLDELNDVGVVDVEVEHDCSVLVHTSAS